ncbi:MAG TPA: hypothetical protein VF755_21445 [Catenuloplanes sp.]|jgi:hypothetical protein
MTVAVPAAKEVRDLLADLLGRPVAVSPGAPMDLADLGRALVAAYTDDTRQLAAALGLDLPLTVYAGAALGLLPPGGAQDCVEDGVTTAAIGENIGEVCNILASLLNGEGRPHVKLFEVTMPGERPALNAQGQLLTLGSRLDLNVEIGGYGKGRLAMSLVA